MSYTIKRNKNGRIIIESDGFSIMYNATMQGALVGKVSLPAKVKHYIDDDGFDAFVWHDAYGLRYRGDASEIFHAGLAGNVPGAIRYNIRKIG